MSDHSSAAQQVQIDLAERSYGIVIGSGLLGHSQTYQGLPRAHSALIVTNTTVAPLYASALQAALQHHHDRVLLLRGSQALTTGQAGASLPRGK